MELKELQAELESMKAALESAITEKAKAEISGQLTEIKSKLTEIEEKSGTAKDEEIATLKGQIEKLTSDMNATVKGLEIVSSRQKSAGSPSGTEKSKTFNEILEETIEANAQNIKSFKLGSPELKMDMKAVGDMNMAANFPGGAAMYIDRQAGMIETPYNRVWLADILPQGNSKGSSILYPKENGGEGGVAPWTDRTVNKAQMDFDLTSQAAYFKWLAGTVIVDREMLDDIPFLLSYLKNKMLISLKTAENDFILNGTADTNPVQGLLTVATPYSGTYTNPVDRIIDSGWGQIVEDTFDFYNPTHTILMPRDSVKIGLNKATGSGEYDLPAGSVAFVNGKLTIGGITAVPTTAIGTNTFLTFDRMATMFVTRMAAELRMFEDATLAKLNRVMFRIEERATLAVFNNAAIVTGLVTPV